MEHYWIIKTSEIGWWMLSNSVLCWWTLVDSRFAAIFDRLSVNELRSAENFPGRVFPLRKFKTAFVDRTYSNFFSFLLEWEILNSSSLIRIFSRFLTNHFFFSFFFFSSAISGQLNEADSLIELGVYFRKEPDDTIVANDKETILHCSAHTTLANGNLSFQWTRNNVNVTPTQRRRLLNNGSLIFNKVSPQRKRPEVHNFT